MRFLQWCSVFCACVFLFVLSSEAQDRSGSITGSVTDTQQASLPGARVELQPRGLSVVSNDQGQFRISNIAPGDYTISVSYLGFKPFSQTVKVTAGQETRVDAALELAVQAQQVVVNAERLRGEEEAINITRTAENIVQVLPSKVITSLPNTNIADAVGRLPSVTLERDEGEGKYVQIRGTEPRLNNTTIDGVNVPSPEGGVRNIKLDVIPSDLVDRIEVNKTLSANQDADAIGGSVNLVTKTPGDKPMFSLSGMGGYTPIQGGKTLNAFSATAGKRFGVSKKFGVLFGGTYDQNNRGIDDLEPNQTYGAGPSGQQVAYVSAEDFRTYKYYRTRYGFAGGADYVLRPGSNIYIRGLYSDFHDFGDTFVYTPNSGNTIKAVNGSQITFDNAADCVPINQAADLAARTDPTVTTNPCQPGFMQYRHYIRRPDQQIFSVLTGGRHDIGANLITYEFAGSRAHNIGGQDFATTNFQGPTGAFDANGNVIAPGVDFGLNLSNPRRPNLTALDGTNIYDPRTYTLVNSTFPIQHSTQLNFQGAATFSRRYNVKAHYGTFELGVKVRNAHKTQNQSDRNFAFAPGITSVSLSDVQGTYTNPGYYDGSFGGYGPTTNYKKIQQTVVPTDVNHISSDPATWDLNERVYAGYLMNTIAFGKISLQTGVRIEATDSNYLANNVTLNNGAYVRTDPVTGNSGYTNVLPSVQVQYLLTSNTNIRATYGMGISRPNFQDLVPSKQVDPNTSPQSLQIGNPALKPTKANNYDLLIEHFFQPLGIIQAGFFYKALTNPIYATVVRLPANDPNYPNYLQQQSINGPSAHLTGFEVAWEQRLSHLPGLLGGLGVAANYSYTTSRVTFPKGFSDANPGGPGRVDHPTLQRQAPNTWNLGMTYDKRRFSMRFGVSHNDANLFAYGFVHDGTKSDNDPVTGLKGPKGDQYLYAHTQFDVQGSYRIYKGLQFVASGLNLSNEVFGFYTGSKIYPNQREYYHPTVSLGMKWTSSVE